MKGDILQIKKYLFLFLTILTTSSIVATVFIYFCIFEKYKEFRKNIGEMEKKRVIVFWNNVYTKKDPYKKEFSIEYEDMLEIIKRCNNISGAILQYSMSVNYSGNMILLRNKKESQEVSIGVSAGYDKLMGLTIKEGRFIEEKDEESEVCVIFESLAKKLEAKVSDTVKYKGKELKIIGIVADERVVDINIVGYLDDVFLPIKIKRQLCDSEERLNRTYGKRILYKRTPYITAYLMYLPEKKEVVYQELTSLLENKYGKDKKFLLGEESTALSYLKFMKIIWIIGLLFVGGVFLLLNKKSLSTFLLLTHFSLVKTCLLIGIASILGIVLGGRISHYLMAEPKITIFSIFISLSIGMIFGLLVAIRTSRRLQLRNKEENLGMSH